MPGVVCYARVSTLEQAENNNSLAVQNEKFREYCRRHEIEILETFVDKQSARTISKRPDFRRMMDLCRKQHGKISKVIVADFSRFARNVGDQATSMNALSLLGIEVISIDEPIAGNTAAGVYQRNMLFVNAQFFSDDLSEKTKLRMQSAVKAGRFIWVSPVGYRNEKNGKGSIIRPDTERAPLVRKGFELIATGGYNADEALRTVTALGLTTRKLRPVPRQTWFCMLRNPIYAGWVRSGDVLVQGVHEAIVPQELFDSVQDILAGRSRTAQPRRTVHPEFSLRQFVWCAGCGKGLTGGIVKGKFPYYWCYRPDCRAVLVASTQLQQDFVGLLGMYAPTTELLEQLPEIAKRRWAVREESIRRDSGRLRTRREEISRLNSAAIKAMLTGQLSSEDFDSLKITNTADLTEIENALKALESEQNLMQELIEESKRELIDLVTTWKKAGINGRKELQTALFPGGLVWSQENGFLNRQNNRVMEGWSEFFQSLGDLKTTAKDFFDMFGVPDGI
ncbi:MAG: recombinase family protein [Terriglobales bacterium]